MAQWFTLSPELQGFLIGAAGNALGNLASDFVKGMLGQIGRSARERLTIPARQQALERAAEAALTAVITDWAVSAGDYQALWDRFGGWLLDPPVLNRFSVLLTPSDNVTLDVAFLREELTASGLQLGHLGKKDMNALVQDMVGAFYTAAAAEAELQEPLKIGLLRQMAEQMGALERYAARQTSYSKQTVDQLKRLNQLAERADQSQEQLVELVQSILQVLHQLPPTLAEQQAAFQATITALSRAGVEFGGDAIDGDKIAGDKITVHIADSSNIIIGREGSQAVNQDLAAISGLLAEIRDRLTRPAQPLSSAELQEIEKVYRQRLIEIYKTLTFQGVSPTGRPIALPLEKVYVELKAVNEIPADADTYSAEERRLLLEAERDSEGQRSAVEFHLDALRLERWRADARRDSQRLQRRTIGEVVADPSQHGLVILGDPGSGKSTLLNYLALTHARRAIGELLPIIVPLAAYDAYLGRHDELSLEDFLALYYEKWRNLPGLHPLFTATLETGRALLLFDGLDEVLKTTTRQFVAEQVNTLLEHWVGRGNRVVVTSRVVGYREAPLRGNLPHVTVLDFGYNEIAYFAHQWCHAYEAWVENGESSTTRQRALTEERALLDDVRSNSSVEYLAANPLLLTMLALLRRQVGKLPDSRIKLYDRYIDTLINNWEAVRSRGARQVEPKRFDAARALYHLMDLALWLQMNRPSGTAQRLELQNELTQICLRYEGYASSQVPGKASVQAMQDAEDLVKDMRHFAGLIVERGRDAFGFLHLTFQEYFVGRALAQSDAQHRWTLLQPRLHQPRWREPILLCAGWLYHTGKRQEASDLVLKIMDAGSDYEAILWRDLFLAAAIAADNVGLTPALLEQLHQRLRSLQTSPIPTLQNAALTALAHLARIGHVPAEQTLLAALADPVLTITVMQNLRPLLGEVSAQRIRLVVSAKLDDSYPPVRAAVVRALAPLVSSDEVLRTALTAKLDDSYPPVRAAVVSVLAPLVSSDEALRTALTAKLDDSYPPVRAAVVSALAPLVSSDEALRTALTAKLDDADNDVRAAAVRALAPLVSSDEALRTALTAKLDDDRWDLRAAVVSALVPLVSSDEALRTALTAKLDDSYPPVRAAAVRALAPLVSSDEALRTALTAKLDDADNDVRAAVVRALAPLVSSDEALRTALTAKLDDSYPPVRAAAVRALAPLVSSDEALRTALTAKLDDSYPPVRAAAVRALAPLVSSDEALRTALTAKLDDDRWDLRAAAVSALAPLVSSDEALRTALTAKLDDADNDVRAAVVSALAPLVSSDEALRTALTAKLDDAQWNVRAAVVRALAPLVSSDEALRTALTAKLDDAQWNVRAAVVSALAPLVSSDEALRTALTAKLDDADNDVRAAAVSALAPLVSSDEALRTALTAKLDDADNDVRAAVVSALAPLVSSDEALRTALTAKLDDAQWNVRVAVVSALAPLVSSDEALRTALTAKLDDADNDVRVAAVSALAPLVSSDEALRTALTAKLDDAQWNVRAAVVSALAPLVSSDEALRTALTAKLDDADNDVREAAVSALAPLVSSDEALRTALTAKLDDAQWNVRAAAVRALVPLVAGDGSLQYQLLPWLGMSIDQSYLAPDEQRLSEQLRTLLVNRYAALVAEDAELLSAITRMLDASSGPFRHTAMRVLVAMPGGPSAQLMPKLIGLLDLQRGEESWPERLQVAALLVNDRNHVLSQHAIQVAVQALDYATQPWYYLPQAGPAVRKQAATILGQLEPLYRNAQIFERLVRLLQEDEDARVRDAAYGALLRLAAAPEERPVSA